jgi:hypothetical protein
MADQARSTGTTTISGVRLSQINQGLVPRVPLGLLVLELWPIERDSAPPLADSAPFHKKLLLILSNFRMAHFFT